MLKKSHLLELQAPLLIQGETGTGKSSLAKWIHQNSSRSHTKMLSLNIAALNENLFESEFFGHEKGSFTGATKTKLGYLEEVGAGLLFLDEIGELSLSLQAKLLTLIEDGHYFKIGSAKVQKFLGRFIFATNKDLRKAVKSGEFREDLYQRIKYFSYEIPPLRESRCLEETVVRLFEKYKTKNNNKYCFMKESTIRYLVNYSWPGNYRELNSVLDFLTTVVEEEISIDDIPIESLLTVNQNTDNYYEALGSFEKSFLERKLKKFSGRINETSRMTNISKVTLLSKIKKYKIDVTKLKTRKS